MKEYSHCYFAFIDLLGFKEIVKKKTCSEIVSIFDEAKKHYTINRILDGNVEVPIIPPEDIHYYIMSDSVCIYIKDDIKSALPVLEWLCMNFQVRMLCLDTPILVRGSISRGEIYEDNGVLFGPALVEAYMRSEKLAHVPRIVIPAQFYEEAKDQTEKAWLDGFTYLEQDGFYVTRYINYFCMHKSTTNYRENVYKYIMKTLDTSLDQSVREKYLYVKSWMDYYYQQEEMKTHEH